MILLQFEDKIVRDGTLAIDTVLRFNNASEVFAFAHIAEKQNCTIIFSNEDITIKPNENLSEEVRIDILLYFLLHNSNKQYIWKYYNAVNLLAKTKEENQ